VTNENKLEEYTKEVSSVIETFYSLIDSYNLFGKPSEDWSKAFLILKRIRLSANIAQKKINFYNDQEKFENYKKTLAEFGFSEEELVHDMFTDNLKACNGVFELIKMFLFDIIDLDELKISKTTTYGTMISKIIDRIFPRKLYEDSGNIEHWEKDKNNARDLFLNKFRTQIVHEHWYYKDRKYTYVAKDENGKPKEISLDFGDVMGDIASLNIIMTKLVTIYMEKYYTKFQN